MSMKIRRVVGRRFPLIMASEWRNGMDWVNFTLFCQFLTEASMTSV